MKGLSIACIDPGETTGLFWGCFGIRELRQGPWHALKEARKQGRFELKQINCIDLGELEASARIADWIEELNARTMNITKNKISGVSVVVIEDFILQENAKKRNLLSPVRITAHIEAFLYMQSFQKSYLELKIKKQMPSAAKTVITNERMLKQGFVWSHARRHEWDAFRHGALYLRDFCNKLE